jgi:tyrosyl-tRNA synthetase
MTEAQDFLAFITERGHKPEGNDLNGLTAQLEKEVVTGYIGFDPTAQSLHIGNLAQVMLLRRLQMCGHRPIALVGGATGKISDPSGRNDMRKALPEEQIRQNVARFRTSLGRFIRFDDTKTGGILVDNAEWLGGMGYLDLLQKVGNHFTINRMLTMDSVKSRLEREEPMTFLEFNYMIMQGYDYVVLKEKYDCTLQMGGSDQWGNILQGIELGRRMKGYNLFGVHQPLLTTASGIKMGKSAGNAVWIDADLLSPYDFWQYWRNVEDADAGRFMRLFTDLPIDETKRLEALAGSEINEAKKILATEVTALVHGRAEAEQAAKTAAETFEQGHSSAGLREVVISKAKLTAGMPLVDLLVEAGLVASKGEAKRLIAGGGAKLNRAAVADEKAQVGLTDLNSDGFLELGAGKKQFVRVKAA